MLKGRGFRCGSDEKMMRMWFGLEIDVVGLPPLLLQPPFFYVSLQMVDFADFSFYWAHFQK